MNDIDRRKILVRHLVNNGIARNQKELGVLLGYKNESAFSQVVNGKVPFPKDFIDKLLTLEPMLNPNWLLYGEGAMLRDQVPGGTNITIGDFNVTNGRDNVVSGNVTNSDKDISKLQIENATLKSEIKHLQEMLSEKDARLAEKEATIKEKERTIGILMKTN